MNIIDFDSDQENYFSWYLDELKERGILLNWSYHPKSFSLSDRIVHVYDNILKTKTVSKDSTIINPHSYQADFLLNWNPRYRKILYSDFTDRVQLRSVLFISNKDRDFSVIDVKGSFAGPHNNSAVTFPLNQKWTFQKYGIYVQKIIPEHLFKNSFVPKKYLFTNVSGKPRKIKFEIRLLGHYLDSIKV